QQQSEEKPEQDENRQKESKANNELDESMKSEVIQTEDVEQNEEAAKKILEKYDRESNYRTRIGRWAWVVTFLGVGLTIFHLYSGYFDTPIAKARRNPFRDGA